VLFLLVIGFERYCQCIYLFSKVSGDSGGFISARAGFEVLQIGEDLHHLMNDG
jgi:hypothetical protein